MDKYHETDKQISREIMAEPQTWEEQCQTCGGSGEVIDSSPAANAFLLVDCRDCKGWGTITYTNEPE